LHRLSKNKNLNVFVAGSAILFRFRVDYLEATIDIFRWWCQIGGVKSQINRFYNKSLFRLYIHMHTCVFLQTQTHIHTHIYIYIYIYMFNFQQMSKLS